MLVANWGCKATIAELAFRAAIDAVGAVNVGFV